MFRTHYQLWSEQCETGLTWEVDGESRFADVEVGLELDGDDVESAVDAVGQQRSTHFFQSHLVLRVSVPNLQDIVRRLRVERQELQTGNTRTLKPLIHTQTLMCTKTLNAI